jgi:hypothetical protein
MGGDCVTQSVAQVPESFGRCRCWSLLSFLIQNLDVSGVRVHTVTLAAGDFAHDAKLVFHCIECLAYGGRREAGGLGERGDVRYRMRE